MHVNTQQIQQGEILLTVHPLCLQSDLYLHSLQKTHINPLPNDWTKLKASADDKIYVVEMTISAFDRVENIVGKGENAGHQHFLLFPQCFLGPFPLGRLKSGFCGKELSLKFNPLPNNPEIQLHVF